MNEQLSLEDKWDRAVIAAQMLSESEFGDELVYGPYRAAFVARPTAVFAKGDVVICYFSNGSGERCWIYGYSTKKHCYLPASGRSHLMAQFARHSPGTPHWRVPTHQIAQGDCKQHRNKSPVRLIEPPDHAIAGLPLHDPVVRAHVLEALQAAYAAFPAGLGSREPSRSVT
jgi:hypothetical protein